MTCFSVIGLKDKILADIQDTGLAHQTFPFLASKMAEYIMKSKWQYGIEIFLFI